MGFLKRDFSLTDTASAWFDLTRGLAAVAVFVSHVRALFFLDFADLPAKNALTKLVYFLTGFGHEAVIVFFVLSGFFISSSVAKSAAVGRWSFSGYAISRLARLYVVLLPALSLCMLWDRLGLAWFGDQGIYSGALPSNAHILSFAVASHLSPLTLLGNAAFLQEVLVPAFGSNSPLWSLSYEFWYYLFFPLLFFVVTEAAGFLRKSAYLGLLLAGLVFVGSQISMYFIVWLLGAACALLPESSKQPAEPVRRLAFGALILATFGALALSRAGVIHAGFAVDMLVALPFAGLVFLLRGMRPSSVGKRPWHRAAGWLAGFSYSLYLLHFPLLVFIQAWLIGGHTKWAFDSLHGAQACGIAALVFVYAWGVSLLTEAHTDKLRQVAMAAFRRYIAAAARPGAAGP